MTSTNAPTMPDFEAAWKQWRDLSVEGWSKMARQMVEGEMFTSAMGASLDWYLTMHKGLRQGAAAYLEMLDMPTRDDLARIATQIGSAEMRVIDCEERLDLLEAVKVDSLQVRVSELEARAARISELEDEMAARLAEIRENQARLDAALAAVNQNVPTVNKGNITRRKKS